MCILMRNTSTATYGRLILISCVKIPLEAPPKPILLKIDVVANVFSKILVFLHHSLTHGMYPPMVFIRTWNLPMVL